MAKLSSTTKLSIFVSIVKGLRFMPLFFLGIHFVNSGLSGAEIGMIFAAIEITSLLLILPSGLSNDKFKSKTLMTYSLLLIAFQYIGYSITTSFPILLLISIIGGIGDTTYRTSAQSLFHKDSQKQDMPKKISIFQSLSHITVSIGMISMGFLLNINYTFEKIFLFVGCTLILLTIIGLFVLPESESTKFELLNYKKDALRKEVLFFLFVIFLFSLHIGTERTSYGLFLNNHLQLNQLNTGLYIGLAVSTMAVTAYILGKKIKAIKPKNVLLFGLLISGLGQIFMITKDLKISFISRVIHEVGDAAIMFFMFYGISKLFNLGRIGGNNSLFNLAIAVGASIGAMILGPFGEIYGYHLPLLLGGITTLIAFIITIPFTYLIDHK